MFVFPPLKARLRGRHVRPLLPRQPRRVRGPRVRQVLAAQQVGARARHRHLPLLVLAQGTGAVRAGGRAYGRCTEGVRAVYGWGRGARCATWHGRMDHLLGRCMCGCAWRLGYGGGDKGTDRKRSRTAVRLTDILTPDLRLRAHLVPFYWPPPYSLPAGTRKAPARAHCTPCPTTPFPGVH